MPVGKVKRVVDGDTIRLAGGEDVRIANLNAPELNEKGGEAAKKRLQQLLPRGTQVGLSPVLARSYGRTVRKVTVNQKPVDKILSKPLKSK